MARVKYVLKDGVRMILDNNKVIPIEKLTEAEMLQNFAKVLDEKEAQDAPEVIEPVKKVEKKKAPKKVSKKAPKSAAPKESVAVLDEEL